jgi:hypothetical protein
VIIILCFDLWSLHLDLSEAFVITPNDSGYSYRQLQDSTCALTHRPTYPKQLDCDLWPAPVLQASRDYPSNTRGMMHSCTCMMYYHTCALLWCSTGISEAEAWCCHIPYICASHLKFQIQDLIHIQYNKLLNLYPVHITLNTAYFLHFVYSPFQYLSYSYFQLCLLIC